MMRYLCVAIGLGICLLTNTLLAAEFTPLGYLSDGYFYSTALDVSQDGSIVVGVAHGGGAGYQAYRWTASTGMQALGDLPGGDFVSQATNISGDGNVIVGQGTVGEYAILDAYRWSADEGMQPIGYFAYSGVPYNYVQGLSADGMVIVGGSSSNAAMTSQAYRWTAETGLEALGDLPGGDVWSIAGDVSADGRIIVGVSKSASVLEPFHWTTESGMQGLGFPPGMVQDCQATAISPNGE